MACRAKQGGRQAGKDATGKFAKSAGSQLRRYNEVRPACRSRRCEVPMGRALARDPAVLACGPGAFAIRRSVARLRTSSASAGGQGRTLRGVDDGVTTARSRRASAGLHVFGHAQPRGHKPAGTGLSGAPTGWTGGRSVTVGGRRGADDAGARHTGHAARVAGAPGGRCAHFCAGARTSHQLATPGDSAVSRLAVGSVT